MPRTEEAQETLTLELNHGEASALCYFIAFAALKHTQGEHKLTPHEDAMVTKVSQMDPSSYEMWQASVLRAVDSEES
jgi:hypothetical protein